jgi:hypothetical protein
LAHPNSLSKVFPKSENNLSPWHCHSRENGNPLDGIVQWMPACAGMTKIKDVGKALIHYQLM